MGLFDIFKKTPLIHDEDFGEMRFCGSKKAGDEYFEAKGNFKPLAIAVEYLVNAPASGPTAAQRSFLRFLEDNYTALTEKMKPLIIDEFRNWKEDFAITDFNKEFIPETITIPAMSSEPFTWDICFTTTHDINHWVTIDFTGYEPTGILIDG